MSNRHRSPPQRTPSGPRHGVARILSKLGVCSRRTAEDWVAQGRVSLGQRLLSDPETPLRAADVPRLRVDGNPVAAMAPVYLALFKPRGYVTTARDERGRRTVYDLLPAGLPWVAPVGRLDQASEGLLLLTNDSTWAARVSGPGGAVAKHYDVQVSPPPDEATLADLRAGIDDGGELLVAEAVGVLRSGGRRAWLRFELHAGRNRQIRRMCAAVGLDVLRLVRVAIGGLGLGDLRAGQSRRLGDAELAAIGAGPGRSAGAAARGMGQSPVAGGD
jgi:23S rRNA pseudouridine2605 synthase